MEDERGGKDHGQVSVGREEWKITHPGLKYSGLILISVIAGSKHSQEKKIFTMFKMMRQSTDIGER